MKLGVAGREGASVRYELVLDDGTVWDSYTWLPSPSVVQHAALATRRGVRLVDVATDRVVSERRRPTVGSVSRDRLTGSWLDDEPALTVTRIEGGVRR